MQLQWRVSTLSTLHGAATQHWQLQCWLAAAMLPKAAQNKRDKFANATVKWQQAAFPCMLTHPQITHK
jgi:hypothetical protein